MKQQAESQQSLVARLRQVRANGRVVLELSEVSELKDIPDIVLEDGDRLYVPPRQSMVSVFGAVFNENTFLFKQDKRVGDYLAQAGGVTKRADASGIYLIRADGTVVSRRQSGSILGRLNNLKPAPGDSIVVPEDLEYVTWTKSLKDLAQIFYQFGLGAAAIKVLRN